MNYVEQDSYAVLSFGGVLGMGEKLFAVPWSALTLDTEKKRFTLDVTKDSLDKAPGFNKDKWPNMSDPAWAQGIHTYYGTTVTDRPVSKRFKQARMFGCNILACVAVSSSF